MAKDIWLDCDPGHDDMMAIILAAHSNKLNLLGISTVHGNQTVDKVTRNALKVLRLCGRPDIDVVKGQAKPLMRPAQICEEIHGESGLDGPDWDCGDASKGEVEGVACNVMFDRIERSFRARGSPVLLLCTASLTNAALLLTLYPLVKDMVEVIIMGGAMGMGNTGPVAEFNIQCDPEAASIVFNSGVKLTMIPLEVTHTVLVLPEVLQAILSPKPTPFRRILAELLMFFAKTYKDLFDFNHPPLHDPCAVAFAIQPEIFEVKFMRVDVETKSELSAGQTVCDVWRQSQREANVYVAQKVDVVKFWNLILDAVDNADSISLLNGD